MIDCSEQPEEWYLIFTEAKMEHWVFKLLDKEISHVYAVKDLNDYQWLLVQPRVNMTQTKIMLKCQYPSISAISAPGDKVVKVRAFPLLRPRAGLCWFTCVEQVKALIGLKSFWTLTPKQLYNGLIGGRYGKAR